MGHERNKKEKEFVDIFKFFEYADDWNREAFCELLEYTMENRKESENGDTRTS